MKNPIYLLFALVFSLAACDDNAQNNNNESGLNELEAWWERNTNDLDTKTNDEWEKMKTEWKELKAKVRSEDLTDEERERYDRMDREFNEYDANFNTETERDNTQVAPEGLESSLLGGTPDWENVNAGNIKEHYIRFMENVRAQKSNWTDAHWESAKTTLNKLQVAKETVEDQIATSDRAKITALELEFKTLETSADVTAGN